MGLGQEANSWLVKVLLILSSCLLGLCCFLVWRAGMVMYRVEQSVVAIGGDVKQVTGTAARISTKLDKAMDRIDKLENKLKDAVPVEELENVLEEVKRAREKSANLEPSRRAEVDKEVQYLLTTIRRSGCRYERDGKETSPLSFYGYLLSKYKLYEGNVTSAEDFIDKVATRTMTGKPYYIIRDGAKVELPAYLRQELAKYRGGNQKGEK